MELYSPISVAIVFIAACTGISGLAKARPCSSKIPQSQGHPAVSGFPAAETAASAECCKIRLYGTFDSGACPSEERNGTVGNIH